jgi:hypothetical protein
VTLQVNVAPSDLPHATSTLSHQLRRWRDQVDEVVYTLDLRKSPGPRGAHFDEYRTEMVRIINELARGRPHQRVVEVDYRDPAVERVGRQFFGGATPPAKDCFGAPFYAYFYGLASVQTRYVLHMDCDILFGGGSSRWLDEAIELLDSRAEVLFVSPLAGPPTATGKIPWRMRRAQGRTQAFGSVPALEDEATRRYRLRHVSSRVFFADLHRLSRATPLRVMDAPPWSFGSDLATTPYLPAETVLSRAMHEGQWLRLDHLGTQPGMWFLHPGQRGEAFRRNLPNLIVAIERGIVPRRQEGSFELRDDWLDAVGPARFERRRDGRTLRRAARTLARLTGARAARTAIWRYRWDRRHDSG